MKLINILPSSVRNRLAGMRGEENREPLESEASHAPSQASAPASGVPEGRVSASEIFGNPGSNVMRALHDAEKPLSIDAGSLSANLKHLIQTRPLMKAVQIFGQIRDRQLGELARFPVQAVMLADLGGRGKNANIEARMKFFADGASTARREFSPQGLAQLAELAHLSKLDLHRLPLWAEDFDAIGGLAGLVKLDLSCCHLLDGDPAEVLKRLRPLDKLVELNLACFPNLPRALESLHALPALKTVDLRGHTQLDNILAGHLQACPRLKSIKVYEAQVSSEIRGLLERRDIKVKLAPALG